VNDTVALEVLSFLFVSQKTIIESLQQNPKTLGPAACCLLPAAMQSGPNVLDL
jgi:hypothetical protein